MLCGLCFPGQRRCYPAHLVAHASLVLVARQEKQSTFDAAVFFLDAVLQQVCAVHLRSGRPGDPLGPTAAAVVAAGEALLQLVSASPLNSDVAAKRVHNVRGALAL